MHIAILGRQPELGLAELERVFGADAVRPFAGLAATIETDSLQLSRLGGTLKAGRVVHTLPHLPWQKLNQKLIHSYIERWSNRSGKLTLGISVYGSKVPARDVQKLGIILKSNLKKTGCNVRLIPNQEAELSTATSHHNKLGLADNKVELLIVIGKKEIIIAESIGAQNITAYAERDQKRPRRDAFVGMLPPKLAQIMINLAGGNIDTSIKPASSSTGNPDLEPQAPVLLDPFCGTGVLLQEAALMGYSIYGTDLSEKMIRYSRDNINWLETQRGHMIDWYLHEGDAMDTSWRQPLDVIACETYLGQPFSAIPSPQKLTEVRGNCDHIISSFLKNLHKQLKDDTPLCIAVPAWRNHDGSFTHLPLIDNLSRLGYEKVQLTHPHVHDLLYYREDQVVARELLILKKITR